MTKQIIETIIYIAFFFFGLYTAYWAGNDHGWQRGYKAGIASGRRIAQQTYDNYQGEK